MSVKEKVVMQHNEFAGSLVVNNNVYLLHNQRLFFGS